MANEFFKNKNISVVNSSPSAFKAYKKIQSYYKRNRNTSLSLSQDHEHLGYSYCQGRLNWKCLEFGVLGSALAFFTVLFVACRSQGFPLVGAIHPYESLALQKSCNLRRVCRCSHLAQNVVALEKAPKFSSGLHLHMSPSISLQKNERWDIGED